jgi:hypothetical protein
MNANTLGPCPAPRSREPDEAADASEHDRDALLDALSERLLCEFSLPVWKGAFLDRSVDSIHFQPARLVFVCTTPLPGEWSEAAMVKLARRFHGFLEAQRKTQTFSFNDAHDALNFALFLQRAAARTLRIALVTMPCTVGTFELEGDAWRLCVTHAAVQRAFAVIDLASPGSIFVSGETYPQIASNIDGHAGGVVATELNGDVVSCAEITFPPPPQSGMSTFAGLGLTRAGTQVGDS